MLRVGLTGGLGSGKSTVAAILRELGAEVLSSDDLGRALMQPDEPVFRAIVEHFGATALRPDGTLDRAGLARLAFAEGRADELNAIVHPAVIARGEILAEEFAVRRPRAVFVIESALLLETPHGGEGGWRRRFDRILLVTAPEPMRVERFVERARATAGTHPEALRTEARRRFALQLPDAEKEPLADWIVRNDGSPEALRRQVEAIWPAMLAEAHATHGR